jgi:hypothetical protein
MNLTPCLICDKAVLCSGSTTSTLANASYLAIVPSYPSNYYGNAYGAIICDDCLDHSIQSKKVTLK